MWKTGYLYLTLNKTLLQINDESQPKTWLYEAVVGKKEVYFNICKGNIFSNKTPVVQEIRPEIFISEPMKPITSWTVKEIVS